MKKAALLICTLFATLSLVAQDFDKFFTDRTLRTDLVFSGDSDSQQVTLRALHSWDGWAGRRTNLSEVPLRGDGELSLTDVATGTVIYRTTFSSLFQEWVTMDEAKVADRAYEFTILTPLPLAPASLKVELYNSEQEVVSAMTY